MSLKTANLTRAQIFAMFATSYLLSQYPAPSGIDIKPQDIAPALFDWILMMKINLWGQRNIFGGGIHFSSLAMPYLTLVGLISIS